MISLSSSSSSFSSFEDLLHQANIVLSHPIPVENLQPKNMINQGNIKFKELRIYQDDGNDSAQEKTHIFL